MTDNNSFAKKLQEIEALYNKLKNGQLNRNEVQDLTSLTRDLYERSIVLQYKIFEGNLLPDVVVEKTIDPVAAVPAQEEVIPVLEDNQPFDLSLFGATMDEVPVKNEELLPEINEELEMEVEEIEEEPMMELQHVVEETIQEEQAAPIVEPAIQSPIVEEIIMEETIVVETTPRQTFGGSGLVERLKSLVDPSESQFGMGGITTLVGSFGLNERLLYINELFGGSSEEFAKAIQTLDLAGDFNQALQQVEMYANQYQWNLGSESVSDFVNKLKRRYA